MEWRGREREYTSPIFGDGSEPVAHVNHAHNFKMEIQPRSVPKRKCSFFKRHGNQQNQTNITGTSPNQNSLLRKYTSCVFSVFFIFFCCCFPTQFLFLMYSYFGLSNEIFPIRNETGATLLLLCFPAILTFSRDHHT